MARTWNTETAYCGKCDRWLPHSAFSRRTDPRYRRPVRSWCKTCESTDVCRRFKEHPEKPVARVRVHRAIARGELTRQPCEVCKRPAQAHHIDYRDPLNVRWLCPRHHNQLHAGTLP